jgi:hypothetical protein
MPQLAILDADCIPIGLIAIAGFGDHQGTLQEPSKEDLAQLPPAVAAERSASPEMSGIEMRSDKERSFPLD